MIAHGMTWAAETPIPAKTHNIKINHNGVAGVRLISANNTAAKNAIPAIYARRLFKRREVQTHNGKAKMATTNMVAMIRSLLLSRLTTCLIKKIRMNCRISTVNQVNR